MENCDSRHQVDMFCRLSGVKNAKTCFLKQGVVNEIIITKIPVLLGRGILLFQNLEDETKLELIKTEKFGQIVDLHYKILK